MSLRDSIFLLAALGHLALAMVSLARVGKSPLARPVTLLAFDFFGWEFAALCNHRFGGVYWRVLDATFTALGPALVLHFVLSFVGKRRAQRRFLYVAYSVFVALAASSLSSFFWSWGAVWIESMAWASVFLAAWLPTLVWEVGLLVKYLRSGVTEDEQARTRIVLAALVLGGAFASTDLWNDMGLRMPGLAPVGTLASTLLLAFVAFRYRLFDRNLGSATTLYAVSLSAAAIVLCLALIAQFQSNLPALAFGFAVVVLLLTALVREAVSSSSRYRERVERLAVLGRFSAQMAHDLKNPLAALVGAVQVLESDSEAHEMRAMIVDQARRIRAIVEQYDRLGRVEPVRSLVRMGRLVQRVTKLSEQIVSNITWHVEVDEDLPECEVDPDLIAGAFENIVRNAMEAMKRGGTLTVRVRSENLSAAGTVVLSVEDTGEGMDARTAERAFDDFYTTKSEGSGLGLAFVRRVALAHGGDVSLVSKQGVGTTVEMRIPMRPTP